jgi:hypothetical protein
VTQKRLNCMLILHVHKDVDKVESDKIAQAFSSRNTQRKSFLGLSKMLIILLENIPDQRLCSFFFSMQNFLCRPSVLFLWACIRSKMLFNLL